MHTKGAEYAHATQTPYFIKGLRSNLGTLIDDGHAPDRMRPVTGITSLRAITFFRIIQGDFDDVAARRKLEVAIFGRLSERDISIDMINVNNAGIFFVCDTTMVDAVRSELADLNLAIRVRPHCAKLSIVGAGMRGTPGVMARIVSALVGAGAEIIHSTDSNITISILVPEEDVARAEQAIHDAFGLGRSDHAIAPEVTAKGTWS
jgi:aspartate kinase